MGKLGYWRYISRGCSFKGSLEKTTTKHKFTANHIKVTIHHIEPNSVALWVSYFCIAYCIIRRMSRVFSRQIAKPFLRVRFPDRISQRLPGSVWHAHIALFIKFHSFHISIPSSYCWILYLLLDRLSKRY